MCKQEATFLFCFVCAYVHLCVCVCVVYIGVWVHIFMPVHVELEEDIPPDPLFFLLFLSKHSRSQTPKLTIFPGWLTSKLPESSWLCLPRLVIQEKHPCLTFYIDAGVLNLGPYA